MELTTRDEGKVQIAGEGLKGPFDAVLVRYNHQLNRQTFRAIRQKRDFSTVKELKAIAFYKDAISKIEAIA